MASTTNTAASMKPILKESYADGKKKNNKKKKKEKFEKIKSMCKCGEK